MSDGEKPLFFGGLPPRGAAAVLERPTVELPTRQVEEPTRRGWNVLAVASFVGAFVISLIGIIGGYFALRQIKRTGERGRYFAIAGMLIGSVALAITIAMVAVMMIGGPNLVASIAGLQERPQVAKTSAPKLSPAEAAAAKEAIASGGGAIPGHIVSGELCVAVKNFQTVTNGTPTSSTSVAPGVLAAMEQLAAVQSPYQSTYQSYVAMAKDPASVPDIDKAQKLAASFAKAVQVDVTTCM
jgi:hypothetical protein